jgi:hypothetical protein
VEPAALFTYLESLWYPPSPAIEARFTAHAEAYDALLERMRSNLMIRDFDPVLFPALPGVLGHPFAPESRDSFYTHASMMELMQRVYIDLDFEHNGTHPHNAGWLRTFHQWASVPLFRRVWSVPKTTYSERFRRFCESELNLPA